MVYFLIHDYIIGGSNMRKKIMNDLVGNSGLKLCPTNANILQGIYNGYYTIIDTGMSNQSKMAKIYINVMVKAEEDQNVLQELVDNMKVNGIYGSAAFSKNTLIITLNHLINSVKYSTMARELVEICTRFFYSHSMPTCCAVCGCADASTSLVQLDNDYSFICNNCYLQLETSLSEKKSQTLQQKSNIVLGIVGAFIGAAIGGALWVFVSQLGYISGIVGLAIAGLAVYGYEKLGGRLTIPGVIISILMIIATVYIAQNISFALDIKSLLSEYGVDYSFSSCYQMIPEFLSEDKEIFDSYITDLVTGYAFTAAASFYTIYASFKKATGSYKLKRFDKMQ